MHSLHRTVSRLLPVAALFIASSFQTAPVCRAEDDEAPAVTATIPGDKLRPGDRVTVSFPVDMIDAGRVWTDEASPPLVFEPKLEFTASWQGQTEMTLIVTGPVKPGTKYALKVKDNVRDLAGESLPAAAVSEFDTVPFTVSSWFDETPKLSAQPSVPVRFSYPVKLAEAIKSIHLLDRDSREERPVEAEVYEDNDEDNVSTQDPLVRPQFRVRPAEPLPPGKTWNLIIENVTDAHYGTPLERLKVVPLGTTTPPAVDFVAAWNYAGEPASILVKFSQNIDDATVTKESIRVEPEVPALKLVPRGREVWIEGEFKTPARYTVHVANSIKASGGYTLPKAEKWGATFKESAPSLVFAPESEFLFRSALGLDFSLLQSNIGGLTWRLARAPVEKLPAINKRLKEFLQEERDPATGATVVGPSGAPKQKPTELLIDAFDLQTVASGTVPASPSAGTKRRIQWKPAADAPSLAGPCLFEVTGKGPDGRTYGNRAIVFFTELYAVQKRSHSTVTLRVARMSDAAPAASSEVIAVTREGIELDRQRTGGDGIASFSSATLFNSQNPLGQAGYFLIRGSDGVTFCQEAQPSSFSSGYAGRSSESRVLRAEYITDRPLYRPGETVKVKGLLRLSENDTLEIPAGSARVTIHPGYQDELVAEFTAPITDIGGWECEWVVPETAATGNYRIRCEAGGMTAEQAAYIQIEEYRPPLFSVVVETADSKPGEDAVKVSSAYFHGAPNNGATVRWKTEWYDTSDFGYETSYVDGHSDAPFALAPLSEVTGEARLDKNGNATLVAAAPFKNLPPRTRCQVTWTVDVLSPEGQTLTGGLSHVHQMQEAILGINTEEQPGEGVKISLSALDANDNEVPGVKAAVELFRVEYKTVREELAPRVARYRNTRVLHSFQKLSLESGASAVVKTREPGEYIAIAKRDRGDGASSIQVSDKTTVADFGDATFAVESELGFTLAQDKTDYRVGETANIQVQSPHGGVAWVAVEARELLDSFTATLDANAGRIVVPIKREYAPNATVSVHLTGPGGPGGLPLERFAYTSLNVQDPAQILKLEPSVDLPVYQPRSIVDGRVAVTSEGKPVENAEVLVYAVDDAILNLGSWTAPNILPTFFPYRPFGVATYTAFSGLIASLEGRALTQKGFIIGDGGAESPGNVLMIRSIFRPLAYWAGNLRTNKDGLVNFKFETPDNLTTYRVCAAGATRENQFGFGDTTFKVSKPLMVEPALPRFLRHGDTIELRAIVRQDETDTQNIAVSCETEGSLALEAAPDATIEAARNTGAAARFRAHVADSGTQAIIRFLAKGAASTDAVEMKLPVVEPFILRHEAQAGKFTDKDLSLASLAPNDWQRGTGRFRGAVSTSPWFPKLNGLPQIYEYPHGCFEQISSRLLVYALLGDLLDYLPDGGARRERLAEAAADGLKKYNSSLLADGSLPYWPGSGDANSFVTAYAAWTLSELRAASVAVDDVLFDKMRSALLEIAAGRRSSDTFSRCLAIMVLARVDAEKEAADAADALYRNREALNDEARALLAVALHRMQRNPAATNQLIAEISGAPVARSFNPEYFGSTVRADAIRIFARAECGGKGWTGADRDAAEKRLLATMDTAAMLSTQENLWSLLAFKTLLASNPPEPIKLGDTGSIPHDLSANRASAGWDAANAAGIDALRKAITMAQGYYVLTGNYSLPERETQRADRGFRVERVVKNLTTPERDGSKDKPYRLGDTLLVTYRLISHSVQYYVALEDALPAGLETINPDISSVGEFFQLPETQDPMLALSHSEIRDKVARLYFDRVEAGPGVAMTLARVTSAGDFVWPATNVTPMYDARISGLSASSILHAVSE